MKTRILLIILLFLAVLKGNSSNAIQKTDTESDQVRICTTTEIRSLTESWVTEYGKANPESKFELNQLDISEISGNIIDGNTLGFVVQRPGVNLGGQQAWMMAVGRDVMVAVINSENPFIETLYEKGVSEQELLDLLNNKNQPTWGSILDENQNSSVKWLLLDEPQVQVSVAQFLNSDPSILEALDKKSTDEFIKAMNSEKYAIGFCKLSTIADLEQNDFVAGIKLLPIDRNSNGKLDYNESFYNSLEQFERSVWIGKYPRPLINTIYAVASASPENKEICDFLSWIVTAGQPFVEQTGYTNLAYNEMQSNLAKLNPPVLLAENQSDKSNRSSIFLIIAIVFIAGVIIMALVIRARNKKAKVPLGNFPKHTKILNEKVLSFPSGLYFDKSHTWVFMEEDGAVKFGIDDFMPNVTGDYTRIILKNPGEKVKRREPIVTLIQKGKQITINAPVSGTIQEINESLVVDPFMINSSPYTDGWVYKIEPSNWFREIQFFKLGNEYREWIKSEINRLKDFLACSFNIENLAEEKLAFQEGGEIIPEPLKKLEPKVWEDFQNYFIESADKY